MSPSRSLQLLCVVVAAVVVSACASPPKSYVVLLESPDGSTGQVSVKGRQGEQRLSRARDAAPLDGSLPPAPVDEARFNKDFAAAVAARPALPVHFQLYFESGGTRLTPQSTSELEQIVAVARQRPAVDVSVIGHTDTVGKAETNEALAKNRANAVADLLKQKGLKVLALSIESHGERNLLVPTPDETAEARNRRVEISIR